MPTPDSVAITAICDSTFLNFYNDCSGFVKAVAEKCGIILYGQANDIVDYVSTNWERLPNGDLAADCAVNGYFVVAGAKNSTHGHVVVVVNGPKDRSFPYGYWGQYKSMKILGEDVNVGFTRGHGTINWAFGPAAQKKLVFSAIKPLSLLAQASGGGNLSSSLLPWIVKSPSL
jgi:hypothetical protein